MLDALIRFVKAHPEVTSHAVLHPLAGKTGLNFPSYALIVPNWKDDKAVLRLVKSGEDWINSMDSNAYYQMERTIAEDVSGMSNRKGKQKRIHRTRIQQGDSLCAHLVTRFGSRVPARTICDALLHVSHRIADSTEQTAATVSSNHGNVGRGLLVD